ncbi:uncharacterized protein LOC105779099 [Gossypium raimondii]|uniref:RING-type E3 ubiquitin transferase n=2 Tax=Gossypium raimondii TaxID=29730 RepID=A0A0D2Q8Z8_GOSRA|nr:uncharacterized protein LOC105779099 [Gossypium raimondii]KJB13361.1 hypothetical protein B456_002G070600 [Gossypium raimondii]
MDCSIFSTSSKLLIFCTSLLFIIFFMCLNVDSVTATESDYGLHCDSVVHESKPVDEEFNISPFPGRQNGYYSGGDNVLNRSSDGYYYGPASKVLVFETHHVYTTNAEDVYKVEGNLIFETSYYYERSFSNGREYYHSYSSDSSSRGALEFGLHGFWSRTTGKLCMVGSGYTYSKEGNVLHLAAVVKFNNVKISSDINTLITGTMDSLNPADEPNYFEPISVLMFPQGSYKYAKVRKQFSQGCPGGTDVPKKASLGVSRTITVCDMFYRQTAFELEYASGCDSSKSCSPFSDGIGYLPRFMHLRMIQCSDDKLSLRFLIEFQDDAYTRYYASSNFSTSLIGEGSWDAKQNRLCIIACRIEDASSISLEKSHVGDCTTRLSVRFPAILSFRNTSTVVGEIWSDKHKNQSGFFDRIMFRNTDNNRGQFQLQGLKYEYMETDKVNKSCPKKSRNRNSTGEYLDGYSQDMAFSMSIKYQKRSIGWGSSKPLAVGDQPHQRFPLLIPSSSSRPKSAGVESIASGSLLNISYEMRIELNSLKLDHGLDPFNQSSNGYLEIRISAEGVYDAETGHLCMVGCRHLRSPNGSTDCDILVNVHFPPLDSDRKGSKIKGSIESTRAKTDHLHFETLEFSGRAYYGSWAMESFWRMDFEMIMSVISNTLAIVFVVLQIFHVRRHPAVCPSVSFLMLVILALGHLIPLVLNLEAMFNQDSERTVWARSGTWLEMNEVVIRAVTMVAFLMHFRLLMLSWTARCSEEKNEALWIAEKRGLYVCLPVYIAGGLITGTARQHSSYYIEQTILGSSRAYAGLILDAFLFPQIIFNMFLNSREPALSRFFYIGITLVRMVPHGYDLYRVHNYVDMNDSYIYADPTADYYSTAWDIIIPMLGLFFAAIIYFQQRLSGRCFLPKRFRESVTYDKLPIDSEDQSPLKSSP